MKKKCEKKYGSNFSTKKKKELWINSRSDYKFQSQFGNFATNSGWPQYHFSDFKNTPPKQWSPDCSGLDILISISFYTVS